MKRFLSRLLILTLALTIALRITLVSADVRMLQFIQRLVNPGGGTGTAVNTAALIGTASIDTDANFGLSLGPAVIAAQDGNGDGGLGFISYGANQYASPIFLAKTRSTSNTCDANTTVSAGDQLGQITFSGSNGTSYRDAAYIIVTADTGWTASNTHNPGAIDFQVNTDGGSGPVSALKIKNDKSVNLTGSLLDTATTNVGWSVVAGANTACNTTCTNACVVGFDTGLGGSDLVDCADATADRCLCAGAS